MLGTMRPREDVVRSCVTLRVAEVLLSPVSVQPRVPVTLTLDGISGMIEPAGQFTIITVPVEELVSQIGGWNDSVAFKL